ncbi:N-6 DNA methylase [Hymenobacter sp. 5317J-9]|uniref:TaqI-like C-terminal specificity domain-containing protein n=1 Tax=Hymenobacter sp. 5317J-9 TaxID=2932250 RepID=UPI001FD6B49B|nr:TaqI-like C-terminal specificity domain-containing protein [Hymenobacter sp. 5317J-9]UOQ99592.1 N-6 DNA methylase [Hymenobacter sp. 5317J-9]
MQTNIFGEAVQLGLTIEQAAKTANVSSATIRNWIKTGYLIPLSKGVVSQDSLKAFMSDVAGKEKLTARANKLMKDAHDHNDVSEKVNSLFQSYTGESIGIEYENSLSYSYRNKEGIYYTPSWIVKDLFNDIEIKASFTFLDPCCGSGNFLIEAIRQGVAPENVYGFDIDSNAVAITKQRIRDEFGFAAVNIKVGDFLQEAHKMSRVDTCFDLIFTNPPWGKKIDKSEKETFSALYGCGNSIDTTSLFFGASLSVLKPNGIIGFLTQEAFFNIGAFEHIRKLLISKKIARFVDYGKAFKGLLTKAQAIIVEKKSATPNDVVKCCAGTNSFYRKLDSFKENPKHIFNFWADENQAQVINQIFSIKHTTLKHGANWALGIVTGNNDKFCSSEPKTGYVPIYKGSDITKNGLKEPRTFILNNFVGFQQVAPLELYNAPEKLIYKFISSDLCFYHDTQQRLILNSANMLIPKIPNLTAKQLTHLLNSDIINWLFNKLFLTHKVLRGDLELLPIHFDYFSTHSEFSETDYLNYLQLTKASDGTYRIKI